MNVGLFIVLLILALAAGANLGIVIFDPKGGLLNLVGAVAATIMFIVIAVRHT